MKTTGHSDMEKSLQTGEQLSSTKPLQTTESQETARPLQTTESLRTAESLQMPELQQTAESLQMPEPLPTAKHLRIALVKQDVYQDLYVCPASEKDALSILLSSQVRVGPIGLMADLNADFYIVKEERDAETQSYRYIIPHMTPYLRMLKDHTLNELPTQEFMCPGSTHTHGEFSISCQDINWGQYDIVISINVSLPTRIIRQYPRTLFAYMIGEANMATDRARFGYDATLNQMARGRVTTNLRECNEIDFPYTFLKGDTLQKLMERFSRASLAKQDTLPSDREAVLPNQETAEPNEEASLAKQEATLSAELSSLEASQLKQETAQSNKELSLAKQETTRSAELPNLEASQLKQKAILPTQRTAEPDEELSLSKQEARQPHQREGIFMEINSTTERPVTKIPPHFQPLVDKGYTIILHKQQIDENLQAIYHSKYFLKMGGRPIRGNSVAEAISLGSLVMMSRDEVTHGELIIDECNVKTMEEAVALIDSLEQNPEEYRRLCAKQQQVLTELFFEKPLTSLINGLQQKRTEGAASYPFSRRLTDKLYRENGRYGTNTSVPATN